jgi:hypothetical protein
MANTISHNNNNIILSDLDSDWVWTDTLTNQNYVSGIHVVSIQFIPGASDDRCIIQDTSVSGGIQFDSGPCADTYDTKIKYFQPKKMRPALDFSAGTYSAGASITIEYNRS